MYKMTVTSKGKNNNIILGDRFVLFKSGIRKLMKLFDEEEATYLICQFGYCGDGAFCWQKMDSFDFLTNKEIDKLFWDSIKKKGDNLK